MKSEARNQVRDRMVRTTSLIALAFGAALSAAPVVEYRSFFSG